MEYIRPKLQINRYKKEPPHILFRKIAHEIEYETIAKLNFSLDYDLSLWLIQLLSLNPEYGIGYRRLFDRAAVDALIKDYLQIVSGNLCSYVLDRMKSNFVLYLFISTRSFYLIYIYLVVGWPPKITNLIHIYHKWTTGNGVDTDPDNLFVAIVKLQVYYMDHYIDKNRIIAKHQTEMNEKMEPLTRQIINTRLKSKTECDEYMKKLAVDIIAHYALGNPGQSQVRFFIKKNRIHSK